MDDTTFTSHDIGQEGRPLIAPASAREVESPERSSGPLTVEASKTDGLKLDRSLNASVNDGMACAVMMGAGDSYLSVYNIFLQASTFQIGLLATLPPLLGAIFQSLTVWMMGWLPSRRRIMVATVFGQALLWLPIALLPFIFGTGGHSSNVLIGLVAAYAILGGLSAPVWNSLLGDLVPSDVRGRFFGYRNRQIGIASFFSLTLAGLLLDISQRSGFGPWGFVSIFMVALVARLISCAWLLKHDDPLFIHRAEDHFSFIQFVRRTPHSNFAKFVFFVASVNFAVHIAGPYFSVYMLRDLSLSYWQFTIIGAVLLITQFMTMQHWGRLCDRFGNKRILNVCSIGVVFAPLMWLCTSSMSGILLIQAYSGFIWAGFNLAASNFIFDAVSPAKRARCVAYQAIINNVFILAGSMVGGYLASHLPPPPLLIDHLPVPSSPYILLFLLSGLGRAVAAAIFLPKFREVREVDAIENRELFWQVVQIRAIGGLTFRPFTGVFHNRKRTISSIVKPRGSNARAGAREDRADQAEAKAARHL